MENQMIVVEAMKLQLANPTRAVVNGESSFVKDRLYRAGHPELARTYWNWVCCSSTWRQNNSIFGQEAVLIQEQLEAIDKSYSMPAWGTYGT